MNISTKQDLDSIRNDLGSNHTLMNDIEFVPSDFDSGGAFHNGGDGWIPIGSLTGIFDGQGYSITGVECNPATGDASLFSVNETGIVRDLHVEGTFVSADALAGPFGHYARGRIERCSFVGTVSGGTMAGGLVGWLDRDGQILNSRSIADVSTNSGPSGGLVGRMRSANGLNRNYAEIENSYCVGSVSGGTVGGLVGEVTQSDSQDPANSTATNCFWNTTVGPASSARGTGKTTSELRNIDTFTNTSTSGLDQSWDMLDQSNHDGQQSSAVWGIDDGNGYPLLYFEFTGAVPSEVRIQFLEADIPSQDLPLSGLRYAVFASRFVDNWVAPIVKGSNGVIDSNREFAVDVNASVGDTVYVYLTDNDGTVSPSSHHGSPVVVTQKA